MSPTESVQLEDGVREFYEGRRSLSRGNSSSAGTDSPALAHALTPPRLQSGPSASPKSPARTPVVENDPLGQFIFFVKH